METMLATISGQFTKSIILGVFLPVVLFVLLGGWLITPLLPPSLPLLGLVKSLDRQWFLFAFTFLIILISGFLYNLNGPIIRLYEGYPWRTSRLGQWLTNANGPICKANKLRLYAYGPYVRLSDAQQKRF